ncbi:MAG TPA: Hsp20/alpha crystallin family protein [Acidobacteriaceae bacterium]|nr:Hsp20/alpha crystallin family protein [Acidobacteriaceae bacterium]
MTTITRFAPFRSPLNDMAVLQNRLNSIFTDFARPEGDSTELTAGNFVPPVDVYEDAQHLVLKFEVPGIKPEDLDIRVENRTLTVRGERKWNNEQKEENFHRVERRYGSFVRSFTLPNTVDTENIQAQSEHGVLELTLNKKPEAKPKQIQVKAVSAGSNGASAPKQMEGQTA